MSTPLLDVSTNDSATPPANGVQDLEAGWPSLAKDRVVRQVHIAMQGILGQSPLERRRTKRWAYPHPVHLMPVSISGRLVRDEAVHVIGKHLTLLGLDFYHTQAVPHRRAVASMTLNGEIQIALVLELAWCRFGRHGYYENGGKFLDAIRSPLINTTAKSVGELAF